MRSVERREQIWSQKKRKKRANQNGFSNFGRRLAHQQREARQQKETRPNTPNSSIKPNKQRFRRPKPIANRQ